MNTVYGTPASNRLPVALFAIPLLGEIPNTWQILGGVIALTGIYLVNQAHNRASKAE